MSRLSTLIIPMLNELLVKEIGEANISPLPWTKVSSDRYTFKVDIKGSMEDVTVYFQLMDDSIKHFCIPPRYVDLGVTYNVAYSVGGQDYQFAKTGLKTLLVIMSTIMDIVKDFVQDNSPAVLYILASEKMLGSGDNTQKSDLYHAFLKNSINRLGGYGWDSCKDGYVIVKK